VKWWVLAIPQYLIVSIFIGGGLWLGGQATSGNGSTGAWGVGVDLVSLLLCISAIALLFTGRYPRQLYDFILGMDRWAIRVAAYTSLMTDQYPPFRLDQGGNDPGSAAVVRTSSPSPSGVPA